MLKKLLVAFDGSPASLRAFEYALGLMNSCPDPDRHAIVLSVAQPPEQIELVKEFAVMDSAAKHFEGLFKELREKAQKQDLRIEAEVVLGSPADEILRYAEEKGYDTIIMGHRGLSGIKGLLLGSVSTKVASHAPCTVVIVK